MESTQAGGTHRGMKALFGGCSQWDGQAGAWHQGHGIHDTRLE